MKARVTIPVLAFLALMCCACSKGHGSSDKPVLAVSIEPQRKILEQLVGNDYEVVTMLPQGANPETFEPTVSQRMKINQADAYFTIGLLPFEETLAREVTDKLPVKDSAEGIALIRGTHSHGDHVHYDSPDPHVWTSARNAKAIGANMLQTLQSLYPEQSEALQQRFNSFAATCDSLDQAIAAQLSELPTRTFAVWHPSLSYFARDYDLKQLAVGQESKEISINKLREIVDEAKADSVQVFFFQNEYDSRQAQNLNKEMGTQMVTIAPLAYDWDNQLLEIANAIAR